MVTMSYDNNQCINNLCTSCSIDVTSQLSWPPGAFFKKIQNKRRLQAVLLTSMNNGIHSGCS